MLWILLSEVNERVDVEVIAKINTKIITIYVSGIKDKAS